MDQETQPPVVVESLPPEGSGEQEKKNQGFASAFDKAKQGRKIGGGGVQPQKQPSDEKAGLGNALPAQHQPVVPETPPAPPETIVEQVITTIQPSLPPAPQQQGTLIMESQRETYKARDIYEQANFQMDRRIKDRFLRYLEMTGKTDQEAINKLAVRVTLESGLLDDPDILNRPFTDEDNKKYPKKKKGRK